MREFHLTQQEAAALGDPMRETRLGPDELITGYRIPARPDDGQAYVKVRERASYEYAIVSAAATVRLATTRRPDDGGPRIATARVALGSVPSDRGRWTPPRRSCRAPSSPGRRSPRSSSARWPMPRPCRRTRSR